MDPILRRATVNRTTDTRRRLVEAGTDQNRKIYGRHGVTSPMHGVSFTYMRKLAKEIGPDHRLALDLWRSGNHDERMLATLIADPAVPRRSDLDAWVRDLDNYVLSDAVADYVGRTPHRDSRADKWVRSPREFVAHTGWNLVSRQAADSAEPDGYFRDRLREIEQGMADAPNRTKHAMHMTLISIGGRSTGLRRSAAAAARRLGTPDVDHGQTSCTTPEAIPYIDRMWEHRATMEERRTARAAATAKQ